ncbi:MAG TPA: Spy/CpxP family protein refolding chaperone [Micropepsaceae bacterium]
MATTIALAAGIEISSAQTTPRALPNLQNQQQEQTPSPNSDNGQYGGRSDFRDGHGFGNAGDRLDRRLAFLHTRLRITAAQERTWMVFAAVLKDEAQDGGRDRGRDANDRRAPSVVERLEERQHRLANRGAELDHVIGALQPLYASFSEEQKHTADRLMFHPNRERGFGGHRRADTRGDRFDRQDHDYR